MPGKLKLLHLARGFRGRAKNVYTIARARVHKALQHAYRGRKEKKRDYRSLWIQRINAGTREHGVRLGCTAPGGCLAPASGLSDGDERLECSAGAAWRFRWLRASLRGPTSCCHVAAGVVKWACSGRQQGRGQSTPAQGRRGDHLLFPILMWPGQTPKLYPAPLACPLPSRTTI